MRIVAVGIDHHWNVQFRNAFEPLLVRIEFLLLRPVLGVDFDHQSQLGNPFEVGLYQLLIPGRIEREGVETLSVHVDFVQMTHDVNTSGLDHLHRRAVITLH